MDENRDLRQHLKRLTAAAYRPGSAPVPVVHGPVPGELYDFEACPEPGVEWLVVEVDAASGDGLLIPADSLSWIGSADVAVSDESAMGPLVLRGDLGVWLGRHSLSSERRAGAVAAIDLEQVRALRRAPAAANVAGEEIDFDTEYRDWRRSLEGARNALARVYGGHPDVAAFTEQPVVGEMVSTPPPKASTLGRPFAIAASMIVALGAGVLMTYIVQGSKIADLRAKLEVERQPQISVPWVLAPFGTTRGPAERLPVPPGARWIALLLDAEYGDRVEIFDAGGGSVWTGVVEQPNGRDETLVVVPATLMPPGAYRVEIWHGETLDLDFDVLIEEQVP